MLEQTDLTPWETLMLKGLTSVVSIQLTFMVVIPMCFHYRATELRGQFKQNSNLCLKYSGTCLIPNKDNCQAFASKPCIIGKECILHSTTLYCTVLYTWLWEHMIYKIFLKVLVLLQNHYSSYWCCVSHFTLYKKIVKMKC